MDQVERNDPETQYSDQPGKRALIKGFAALAVAIAVTLVACVLASFGVLPALLLLALSIPLGLWGTHKVARNETQVRQQQG
ncbi:MAG TPA: hypothetical protein VNN80_29080 [Polyangiaceae bacterium]|jgi:Flp pilus assembly protein TadB|nr:hypothetical protein [Polyangiaceae bacterium]